MFRQGLLIAVAMITFGLDPQQHAHAQSVTSGTGSPFADIKTRSAALVAADRPRLNALSPGERLAAPPVIWTVEGSFAEFSDCPLCPPMVVMPAGEFTMGSPPAELGAETQHRVAIVAPFAIGKFEITFDEWDACVSDGGCGGYRPDDEGWGRGKNPVINISWDDATAYVTWLARKTGRPYRLLSEAEWEFAARAGTTAKFSVGDAITPAQANYNGSTDGTGPSEVNRMRTLSVGSFPPNGFGLHDTLGNVSEWVADCWHDDYTANVPTDGTAWLEGRCGGRVVRGGSWEDSAAELRSAARTGGDRSDRFYTDGIRVARDL
jgi:formylglycine-generating enzyme required for sulfatase activity